MCSRFAIGTLTMLTSESRPAGPDSFVCPLQNREEKNPFEKWKPSTRLNVDEIKIEKFSLCSVESDRSGTASWLGSRDGGTWEASGMSLTGSINEYKGDTQFKQCSERTGAKNVLNCTHSTTLWASNGNKNFSIVEASRTAMHEHGNFSAAPKLV